MHKTQEFTSRYLTWRQLRDYLNSIKDEDVLDTAVICQEHHHFRYIRCNSVIECRMDLEKEEAEKEAKRTGRNIANSYYETRKAMFINPAPRDETGKIIYDISNNGPWVADEYMLEHERQPNLSLMI